MERKTKTMDDAIHAGIPIEDDRIIFSEDHLPPEDDSRWSTYQKKVKTKAIRIEGPFTVETSEGPLKCNDGYLAIDARGYPYPIAADEFQLIYEEVNDGEED
jgi:hypothetical protein